MKASILAASVALAGSVAASQHKAHRGFHLRREYETEDVCTVYTTVYVSALPSMAPNSTVSTGYEQASSTSSCTEEETTPVYSLYVPSSSSEAPKPTKEAYTPAPVPASSKPAYTPVPSFTKPADTSKPAYTPVPYSTKPAEAPKPVVPSSKEAEKPKPAPSTSKVAEKPKPVPTSKAAEKPKPAPTSTKAASKPKPKPTGSYSTSGRIVTKGNKWAITYTPYANDGNCKTAGEIQADVKKIAELGFTTIRSYSTDCGVFEHVVPACQEHNLKVIYGIFLEGAGKGPHSDYANAQLEDIKNKAPHDSIAMIIVGNECMFNNNCQPADLASYIDYVREQLQGAGFPTDIAITTTEPVSTWEEKGAALCAHIDVFTVQVQAYFTASVTAETAGQFVAQQLAQAAKVCPEAAAKGQYVTEAGWPNEGDDNGMAVAGPSEQAAAMKSIIETIGASTCVFSFQNDGWKAPGPLHVEQNFGCVAALP